MHSRCDVLTITPNPSIDLLHEIDTVLWDDANRVDAPRRRAGGQGVNVARAMVALGGSAHAVLPLGGPAGRELESMLAAESLPFTAVRIAGQTRTFAALQETTSGRSLLINPRGPTLDAGEARAFAAEVEQAIMRLRPRWVAACGSLPPGLAPDFYARIATAARGQDASFVADCDGEPLRLACHAGCDLLVPNRYEAARLAGSAVDGVEDALRAARTLVARGTPMVAVTLGADGAVIATGDYAAHAYVRARARGSTVGAGDTFLAALIHACSLELAPAETLRRATAAGAAVLSSEGENLVDRSVLTALVHDVQLTEYR